MADELAPFGNALKLTKFNLHVLPALFDDMQDVVSGILNRNIPTTYTVLHGLLFSYESIHAFKN